MLFDQFSETTHTNQHVTPTEAVLHTMPWYDDLHSIWQGNPSFDSDLVNSTLVKNSDGYMSTFPNKTAAGTPTTPGEERDCLDGGGEMRDDQQFEDGEIKDKEPHHEGPVMNEGEAFGDPGFDQEGMDFGNEEQDVDMDSVSMRGDQVHFH